MFSWNGDWKKTLPANCISQASRICWMEICLKEGKKNFQSKYHDVKVKSLKQRSTLMCIFYVEEKKKEAFYHNGIAEMTKMM